MREGGRGGVGGEGGGERNSNFYQSMDKPSGIFAWPSHSWIPQLQASKSAIRSALSKHLPSLFSSSGENLKLKYEFRFTK